MKISAVISATQLGEISSQVNAFTPAVLIISDLQNKLAVGYSVNDIVQNIPSLCTSPIGL